MKTMMCVAVLSFVTTSCTTAPSIEATAHDGTVGIVSDGGQPEVMCRATILYKPVPQNDMWVRVGEPADLVPDSDARSVVVAEPVTDENGNALYLSLGLVTVSTPP
jgi:hypothetical protein